MVYAVMLSFLPLSDASNDIQLQDNKGADSQEKLVDPNKPTSKVRFASVDAGELWGLIPQSEAQPPSIVPANKLALCTSIMGHPCPLHKC